MGPSGSASSSCTITISAATTPLLLACPSGSAQMGTAYSSALVASGGTGPYTYSITTGTLPPPLALNSLSGAITGTPNTQGTYPFSASVTDSTTGSPQTTPASCSINVAAASTVPVTVQTSPDGRSFTVDGTTYTTAQTLNWVPGEFSFYCHHQSADCFRNTIRVQQLVRRRRHLSFRYRARDYHHLYGKLRYAVSIDHGGIARGRWHGYACFGQLLPGQFRSDDNRHTECRLCVLELDRSGGQFDQCHHHCYT